MLFSVVGLNALVKSTRIYCKSSDSYRS